ncbi:sulfite reductase flavoprotein component [Histoplasma capsulatum H143]|uniref:Sulfite reductase flavoprotein component n=1 Tax=Ajellomyces capsulatus (strain H143) TaxID=544712 RepID=C6HD34_AJECH|nr:sulfite reductase flavoprotein component [Histoplasma capsulatum H143]
MRSVEPASGASFAAMDNPQLQQQQPFDIPPEFSDIRSPIYLTAQTLIQQVAYALSDKLFTYSPDTFDLDVAVKQWAAQVQLNANGSPTAVQSMQTRVGAGAIALGYIFSKDFDLKRRHIPQSIIASSATLQYLRPALEQLSLLYSVANPVVAHVAAVDYTGGVAGGLVADYTASLTLAEELGLGLVASFSAHESQHMALFSTLLAIGREITQVADVLDLSGLSVVHQKVLQQLASDPDRNHLDAEGKLLRLLKAFNGQLGTSYSPFEYSGHPEATSVLVSFGTVESSLASQIAASLAKGGARVGVVNVRVYRPFVEESFLGAMPKTTKVVGVLGQVQADLAVQEDGVHSALYEDVLAALTFGSGFHTVPQCVDIKYAPSHSWTPASIAAAFQKIANEPLLLQGGQDALGISASSLQLLSPSAVQQYTFWDTDDSATNAGAIALAAFLRVALPGLDVIEAKKLALALGDTEGLSKAAEILETVLRTVEIPESWASSAENEPDGASTKLPVDVHATNFTSFNKSNDEEPSILRDWQDVAKALVFKEAYGATSALRPDLAAKTFTIHVSENRRLTPKTYDLRPW